MNLTMLFYLKLWVLAHLSHWVKKPEPDLPENPLLLSWQVFQATLNNISASDLTNANVRTYALEPIRSTHKNIKEAIGQNARVLSMLRNNLTLQHKNIIHISETTPLGEYLLDDKGNYLIDNAEAIAVFYDQCIQLKDVIIRRLEGAEEFKHDLYFLNMYLNILSNTLEDLLATNQ